MVKIHQDVVALYRYCQNIPPHYIVMLKNIITLYCYGQNTSQHYTFMAIIYHIILLWTEYITTLYSYGQNTSEHVIPK